MTKHERKAIVRALTAAKKHLWDGQLPQPIDTTNYICYALREAQINYEIDYSEYELAGEYIHELLYPCSTLHEWLSENLKGEQKTAYRMMRSAEWHGAMQTHRHAWVDKIIADLSK